MDMVKKSMIKEKKSRSIFKRFFVFLIILAFLSNVSFAQITLDQASLSLLTAENDVKLMISAGFNVTSLTSALNAAKDLFDKGSYDQAYELANQISLVKQKAFSISDRFDIIDSMILDLKSKGVDIQQQLSDYNKAKNAFYAEDYTTADSLSNDILNKLDNLESQFALNKTLTIAYTSNLVEFIKSNLALIIVLITVISILGFVFYKKYKRVRFKKKLIYLNSLENSVKNLIKEAQRKYFVDKTIDKSEYELRLEEYNQKLADIKREVNVITSKLKE